MIRGFTAVSWRFFSLESHQESPGVITGSWWKRSSEWYAPP